MRAQTLPVPPPSPVSSPVASPVSAPAPVSAPVPGARSQARVLYFDIDGTLVDQARGVAKRALAGGRFERLVRAARFDRLVCVDTVPLTSGRGRWPRRGSDPWRGVFRRCRGTIADYAWLRLHARLVGDPASRGTYIDLDEDWYYVDDHAHAYAARAGIDAPQQGRRILQCEPAGAGLDVHSWLDSLGVPAEASHEDSRDPAHLPWSYSVSSGLSLKFTPYLRRRL